MKPSYRPPFTITPEILNLVSDISVAIGELPVLQKGELRLRRINRIRTIQASLAIEGNTLSEEQITALLDGKRVLAPQKEIQEARGALKAYEKMDAWNPSSLDDLLAAHGVLMAGLLDTPGAYRSGGAGIMKGTDVIHVAPPARLNATSASSRAKDACIASAWPRADIGKYRKT